MQIQLAISLHQECYGKKNLWRSNEENPKRQRIFGNVHVFSWNTVQVEYFVQCASMTAAFVLRPMAILLQGLWTNRRHIVKSFPSWSKRFAMNEIVHSSLFRSNRDTCALTPCPSPRQCSNRLSYRIALLGNSHFDSAFHCIGLKKSALGRRAQEPTIKIVVEERLFCNRQQSQRQFTKRIRLMPIFGNKRNAIENYGEFIPLVKLAAT